METLETPVIKTKSPDSMWVALDNSNSNVIITEGKTPDAVTNAAIKTGKEFTLMFVPKSGVTYIL